MCGCEDLQTGQCAGCVAESMEGTDMELIGDLSFFQLVTNASLLVQLVMGLLLLVSLMSWWYIFLKMFAVRAAVHQSREFEEAFWGNSNLNALYQQASSKARQTHIGAQERIFAAGFRRVRQAEKDAWRGQCGGDGRHAPGDACHASSARWTTSNRTCPFWPRSVRSARMSACSARCGAS